MTEGSHRREDPEFRPRPARPEIVVEPLRTQRSESGPSRTDRISLWAWVAVAVIMAALAAVVGLQFSAVRTALETSVAQEGSGATAAEISETVTVTLLGSGVVAVFLLVLAALGLSIASAHKVASGSLLMVVGLATIGASVLFYLFMTGTGSIAAGALQWGPLACAGVAAIATTASGLGLARK